MNFNFAESVKLATKGYKPSDISELSKLDESKFNKEDILSLINNGYSKQQVTELVNMFSDHSENNEDEEDLVDDGKTKNNVSKSEPDNQDEEDDAEVIDYKALYEKEKKLREKLQHTEIKKDAKIEKHDDKSDFEIALDYVNDL